MYKVGVGSMPSRLLASPFETLAGNGKVKKLTNIFRGVETTNQTRFTIKSRARSRLAECCRGSTSKDWLDCAEKKGHDSTVGFSDLQPRRLFEEKSALIA